MKEKKYISLKEAAKISGYAPDYVGQLIRNGKIPGKQVYCNIAWVTTEEAVHAYKKEGKKEGKQPFFELEKEIRGKVRKLIMSMNSETKMASALKIGLFGITAISVSASLVLALLLLMSIGRRFENQRLETESSMPRQATILENVEL